MKERIYYKCGCRRFGTDKDGRRNYRLCSNHQGMMDETLGDDY